MATIRGSIGARATAAAGIALALGLASPVFAKVFMTQDEAIASALGAAPGIERATAYLTDAQAERIRVLSGTPPATKIVVFYRSAPGVRAGVTAYFDTHVVRTLAETIMIVVAASGKVDRVEILSFDEPEDYLPKRKWLDQFNERPLDGELSLATGLRAVTGATLSSSAITDAVRRVLATHAVLNRTGEANAPGKKP